MPSEDEIVAFIANSLRELSADVGAGSITAATTLQSLGLRSILIVYALAEIQDHFGVGDRLFESVLASRVPLGEQRVGDLARYLAEALRSHAP